MIIGAFFLLFILNYTATSELLNTVPAVSEQYAKAAYLKTVYQKAGRTGFPQPWKIWKYQGIVIS